MSMTNFLEVNGSLSSSRRERWFRLPHGRSATRSLRFGRHALVAGSTMQIVPLGDTNPIEQQAAPAEPKRESRVAGMLARSRLLSFLM